MIEFFLYSSLFTIWLMLFYHLFLMLGGYLFSIKHQQVNRSLPKDDTSLPIVSILIPAHNEEMVIKETIKSMVRLQYPKDKLEVIIINDNSMDATGTITDEYASKYEFINVIHNKPPFAGRGKSGALNVGLRQSSGEIIVVYDADNTPEPDAVRNLVLELQKDQKAAAVVGKFRVINHNKNLLTRFINIETITFQWLAQAGRWFWFKITSIPGTNFAIRRSVLEELGGWDVKALSEDTELSIRVYNLGHYIRFIPTAVTWEQEPETFRVWWKQRTRWACGNIYVIQKYLLRFHKLKRKRIVIDLIYFLLTYFLFLGGILISHILFVLRLFFDFNLSIGLVSYVLLILGFLLFVTEVLLALSMEKGQLHRRNLLHVVLMYFVYSQLWLGLMLYSLCKEMKRTLFKQEVTWYKTQRFKGKLD